MKKCIVLDLDNTLWGGIVGEDGIDGIQLSVQAPGNSFLAFQQALLDLNTRGILLAINSRNNPEDAWAVIRTHPNMILKEKNFAAVRINWNDKATNIREIAQELNIGLDSMVFLDDDPTNRALVRSLVPEVETPELPQDPALYTRFLLSLPYFDTNVVTDEDSMRGNMYVTERLRIEEEKQYPTKEAFLEGLGLELHIYENDASYLPRLAQMTEKTNQFNTLKRPYTEEELQALLKDGEHVLFFGRLADRFGDYGVVVLAIIHTATDTWDMTSLLMSCRVFGRGVEDAFLGHIIKRAQSSMISVMTIAFEESPKNLPAKQFVDKHFINQRRLTTEPFQTPSWITTTYENI